MENQNMPPSLRELQDWIRWIVTDPRGVREALADPFPSYSRDRKRYTSPPKSSLPWIADTPQIEKVVRLDIYAEAYFSRVLDSMKVDFPITAKLLDDVSFQKLVSDYLKQFPSQTTNISEIGRNFSEFVASYADLESANFLESLTKMEWLTIESFYADDSGFLDPSNLASLSDEDWENATFTVAPSVCLLESQWPLDLFWKLQFDTITLDSIDLEQPTGNQGFLIFRDKGLVSVEKVTELNFSLLGKLKNSHSLVAAVEYTQNKFPHEENESEIMNSFNEWVTRGIIYELTIKNKKANL